MLCFLKKYSNSFILGIGFQFIFICSNVLNFSIPARLHEDDLGLHLIMIVSICYGLANLFMIPIMRRLGYKQEDGFLIFLEILLSSVALCFCFFLCLVYFASN